MSKTMVCDLCVSGVCLSSTYLPNFVFFFQTCSTIVSYIKSQNIVYVMKICYDDVAMTV